MPAVDRDQEALARARQLLNVPWCDQYERMISGMEFDSSASPELEAAAVRAKRFCQIYNTTEISETATMKELFDHRGQTLTTILGHVGLGAGIEPPFNFTYGCNTSIGNGVYSNINLSVFDSALVTIGDRVLIGPNVSLVTDAHDTEVESRDQGIQFAKPIVVGEKCWLGAGATVLPGVTIGKRSVVGAGAVVTRDVPDDCLVLGVPARVVKKLNQSNQTVKEDKKSSCDML